MTHPRLWLLACLVVTGCSVSPPVAPPRFATRFLNHQSVALQQMAQGSLGTGSQASVTDQTIDRRRKAPLALDDGMQALGLALRQDQDQRQLVL